MNARTRKSANGSDRIAVVPGEPSHDEIALCAMSIWIEEGRPEGRDLDHWFRAESRLRQVSTTQVPVLSRPASRARRRSTARAGAVVV